MRILCEVRWTCLVDITLQASTTHTNTHAIKKKKHNKNQIHSQILFTKCLQNHTANVSMLVVDLMVVTFYYFKNNILFIAKCSSIFCIDDDDDDNNAFQSVVNYAWMCAVAVRGGGGDGCVCGGCQYFIRRVPK